MLYKSTCLKKKKTWKKKFGIEIVIVITILVTTWYNYKKKIKKIADCSARIDLFKKEKKMTTERELTAHHPGMQYPSA